MPISPACPPGVTVEKNDQHVAIANLFQAGIPAVLYVVKSFSAFIDPDFGKPWRQKAFPASMLFLSSRRMSVSGVPPGPGKDPRIGWRSLREVFDLSPWSSTGFPEETAASAEPMR